MTLEKIMTWTNWLFLLYFIQSYIYIKKEREIQVYLCSSLAIAERWVLFLFNRVFFFLLFELAYVC